MFLWMNFASVGYAQQSEIEICLPLSDTQKIVRDLRDCDFDKRELAILRDQGLLKDQRIIALEKEIDLIKRETELKDRIIAIKDMEIAANKRAFEDMKEVSDRAIKLVEVGKPKSNWELQGLLAIAAFVIGALIVK